MSLNCICPQCPYSKYVIPAGPMYRILRSVPARLGKRAGCKRNWAQSSVRTTKIRAQFSAQTTQNRAQFRANDHFYAWTTKIRSQSSMQTKQDLGTILRAIDEIMGTNLQALYSCSSAVWKHKNRNYILYFKKKQIGGRVLYKSDRVQDSTGRAQRPRKYAQLEHWPLLSLTAAAPCMDSPPASMNWLIYFLLYLLDHLDLGLRVVELLWRRLVETCFDVLFLIHHLPCLAEVPNEPWGPW